jgi:transcriptional antiterminator RfaH
MIAMAYWTAAQLEPNRTRIALQLLVQEKFIVYAPRLRERRIVRGRREDREMPLFPGYAFVLIQLQWHAARWCPGVRRLVMDGLQPARVPDAVIEGIRARERNGAIELPKNGLKPGVKVRLLAGPFREHVAIYAGMSGLERVAVLLSLLGGERRITLARRDIEIVGG